MWPNGFWISRITYAMKGPCSDQTKLVILFKPRAGNTECRWESLTWVFRMVIHQFWLTGRTHWENIRSLVCNGGLRLEGIRPEVTRNGDMKKKTRSDMKTRNGHRMKGQLCIALGFGQLKSAAIYEWPQGEGSAVQGSSGFISAPRR